MLLLLFLLQLQGVAQEKTALDTLLGAFATTNKALPDESVYLHTDRNSYWASDDVWFKAYMVSKVDSSNLYVELISPWGEILQKKMYLSVDGLAYGDMHLPDTTSSGVYQIRAYTNWMRNFGDAAFYKKEVVIWNIRDRTIASNLEAQQSKIHLSFYPEGGTFVSGVKNKLGFKAVDENGVGVAVNGSIVDEENTFITAFNSQYKGMGSVTMVPIAGKKYKAILTNEGNATTVSLPEAAPNGVTLGIETVLSDDLIIGVFDRTDNTAVEQEFYLVGQTRGVVLFSGKITTVNHQYLFRLSRSKIPSGIVQVTLFDANLNPRCERLVFINHNDYVPIQIHTDKNDYSTRELTEVQLKSMLRDSIPLLANLSISVFSNDSELKIDQHSGNILTHFLLESDLKGRVEGPAYYFKDDSRATKMALDNLMLTQGWRRFTWEKVLNETATSLPFERESSIVVKGKVTTKFFEKPLFDVPVSLFLEDKNYAQISQNTDTLGQFRLDEFYFFDASSALFKIPPKLGGRNTWLTVDEKSLESPELSQLPVNYVIQNEKKISTTYDLSIKDSSLIQRKWHISDTILLNDINIIGTKAKDPFNDDLFVFPDPDRTIKINEEEDIFPDIFMFLEQKYPVVHVEYPPTMGAGPIVRIGGNQGSALLLLDGMPVDSDLLSTLPFSYFKQIDVQRISYMFGIKGQNGAINFTSRGVTLNAEPRLPDGIYKMNLQGYAISREFYAPNYEDQKPSMEKRDFRSTLYWNPLVWTNDEGKSVHHFYNSDQPGDVSIVVEGFTRDGRICRGTASYKIRGY